MLNISQTATNTAIVTTVGEWETAPKLLNGTSFSELYDFKVTILFNVK